MIKKVRNTNFYITQREIHDLVKAWILLSLAFTIAQSGLSISFAFISLFVIFILTIGTAFIFHEMAHKIMAQYYGCHAEFRSFDKMLWFAVLFSFLGFIFAAPGAVMIQGPLSPKRNGKIAAVGPATNMILALLFLFINLNTNLEVLLLISFYGFLVNSILAFFNMLPFLVLDGKKVLHWNKTVYAVMMGISVILLMMQNLVSII